MKIYNIMSVLIIGTIIFVAGCSGIPGIDGETTEGIEIIDSNQYSNYPQSGVVHSVIENEVEFASEWGKVHKGTKPTPELPKIDFTIRTVVLAMLDTKGSGGYEISDIKVVNNNPNLVVTYTEIRPGSGCVTTRALTKPYAFISIPTTNKSIQFQTEEPVINSCN